MGEAVTRVFIDEKRVAAVRLYLRAVSKYVDVVWFGPRIEPHIGENFMLKAGVTTDTNFGRMNEKSLSAWMRILMSSSRARPRFVSFHRTR